MPAKPATASHVSAARVAANRANAQQSTGPRSLEGKAASARNATTHGLLTQQPILPGEDPDVLDAISASLLHELAPATAVEELLVNDIISLVWRLRRVVRVELALYAVGLQAPAMRALSEAGEGSSAVGLAFVGQAPGFALLSRYETALIHRLRRSLLDLEQRQADRSANVPTMVRLSASSRLGFVPQSGLPAGGDPTRGHSRERELA